MRALSCPLPSFAILFLLLFALIPWTARGQENPCQAAEKLKSDQSVMRYFHFQVGRLEKICQSGQEEWLQWMASHQQSLAKLQQLDLEFSARKATAETEKDLSVAEMAERHAKLIQIDSEIEKERNAALGRISGAQATGEVLLDGILQLKIFGVCQEMRYVPAEQRAECSQAAKSVDEFARWNKDFVKETLHPGFIQSQTNQKKTQLELQYGRRFAAGGGGAIGGYANMAAANATIQKGQMPSLTAGQPSSGAQNSPAATASPAAAQTVSGSETGSAATTAAATTAAPTAASERALSAAATEVGQSPRAVEPAPTAANGTHSTVDNRGFGADVLQSAAGLGGGSQGGDSQGDASGGAAPTATGALASAVTNTKDGACKLPAASGAAPAPGAENKIPNEKACRDAGGQWIRLEASGGDSR